MWWNNLRILHLFPGNKIQQCVQLCGSVTHLGFMFSPWSWRVSKISPPFKTSRAFSSLSSSSINMYSTWSAHQKKQKQVITVHANTFFLLALQHSAGSPWHPFQSISHVSLTLPLQICNPLSEKGINLQQQHSAPFQIKTLCSSCCTKFLFTISRRGKYIFQ